MLFRSDRDLNHDTVEGFCELVAYKLMAARREEVEKKVILANAYTRGQVNAFVQAESSSHFLRIVDWIKTGVDASIGEGEGGSSIVERRPDPPPIVWRTAGFSISNGSIVSSSARASFARPRYR